MPNPKIPLEPGKFYHIYNRGNNRGNIFFENDNYEYFLKLYEKHISGVANTLAWVFMKNHFHLLVQILPAEYFNLPDISGILRTEDNKKIINNIEKHVSQQFSNLFNAYSKAVNKRFSRTGSLFEHTFRRKLIEDESYLKQLIIYIHQNPVNHGFCSHPSEYPWSSFLSCVSLKPKLPHQQNVIGRFNNEVEFVSLHNQKQGVEIDMGWINE